MYKKTIIIGTILSLFGGLFINNKENKIKEITYEIHDNNFENIRKLKQKIVEDYQNLSMSNIKDTHQNLVYNLDTFLYEKEYQITYKNYNLKIICSNDSNYIFKGYLYQQENENIVKTNYFFKKD